MRWPPYAAVGVTVLALASSLPRGLSPDPPCMHCVTVINWQPHVEEKMVSQVFMKEKRTRIAATGMVTPSPKPLAMTKPAAAKKKVVKNKSALCSLGPPQWYRRADGHRKYRCPRRNR